MKKFILFAAVCVVLLMSLAAFAESGTWKIVFDNDQYAVYVGKQVRITASAEAESGDAPKNLSLIWTSSDETIAKVSNNGTVVGVSGGNATITATARNDESITKSVEVEVRKPVRSVSIEPKTVELTVGAGEDKAVVSMSAIIDPEDAYDQSVVWSIGNENVATVDEKGVVTAHARGNTNLTATSTDPSSQKKTTVKIVVSQAVTGIEINPKEIAVPINKSANLKAVLSPADCSNKKVVWSSADEGIATVTAGGAVKAVSLGETVITCEAADGSGVKATCKVTVVSPVKKITLSEAKSFTLPVGLQHSLTAAVEPEDATVKDIVWSSSNEKVATVDQTGRITGLAPGNATITASAVDGSNVKASVSIKFEQFDLVFTDRSDKTATYYYGSGRFTVKGTVKNGNVSIPDITTTIWAAVVGGYASSDFSVTPLKPGIDTITVTAGRVRTSIKVYVSPEAFGPVKINDLGFGKGAVAGAGVEGVFEGHTYKIVQKKMTWKEASNYCAKEGGHLATITSQEEQKFVDLLNSNNRVLWIGCERGEALDDWKWITGEPYDYTNWADGEPNNYNGDETKGAVRPSQWNDFNKNSSGEVDGFLCEWDSVIIDVTDE